MCEKEKSKVYAVDVLIKVIKSEEKKKKRWKPSALFAC